MIVRSRAERALAQESAAIGERSESGSTELVAAALEAALRARAPGLHASTPLVVQLARRVARELNLDAQSQLLLEASVRVRDIGMIALPDTVVHATQTLAPADWELVNRHPILGAELLEGLPLIAPAAPIVRSHHERWDGEGYPDGRRGDAIPLLSQVIALCDAFVAMASDRPYRRGIGTEAALEHIRLERGVQFDPHIADTFVATVAGTRRENNVVDGAKGATEVTRARDRGRRVPHGRLDLSRAIADFDVVPAFAPACEKALDASDTSSALRGEMVVAIESDTGLTVAVLRKAQARAGPRPIANVADAVAALTTGEIEDTIKALPRAQFPWRTTPLEVLMHRSRIHSQAVTRAADRIARELGLVHSDDLLAAALLHDIGKLVLTRVGPGYADATVTRSTNPEERVRNERRTFGMDHASLGGMLLQRWGLPNGLASAIAEHHSSEAENAITTYVRLADMLVRHAQGDAVDRTIMLRVAHASDLSTKALRDVMFDLPHSGGSRRRRAEPSPLSVRESEVLRLLGQGKVYKLIALELNIAATTVRSHLHNTYQKLAVTDRAQAVLRATEMGWI